MNWYWEHYLHRRARRPRPAGLAAAGADHAGLPPALVITAEYDPLRDEGEQYAERLRRPAYPSRPTRYHGMVHGFFAMAGTLDAGRRAIEQAAAYLRTAFADAPKKD